MEGGESGGIGLLTTTTHNAFSHNKNLVLSTSNQLNSSTVNPQEDITLSEKQNVGGPITDILPMGSARQSNNSLITLKSLRDAELFEKDIGKIMSLVTGIEQDYAFHKITEQLAKKRLKKVSSPASIAQLNNSYREAIAQGVSETRYVRRFHKRNISQQFQTTQFNSNSLVMQTYSPSST